MKKKNEQAKKEEDNEYMLNILLKENNMLKNLVKNMSSNKNKSKSKKKNIEQNSNIFNTILSMVEVLALQREKITAIKKGKKYILILIIFLVNDKMSNQKIKLLEKLKKEDFKYKTKQFMDSTNYSIKSTQSIQRKKNHHQKKEEKTTKDKKDVITNNKKEEKGKREKKDDNKKEKEYKIVKPSDDLKNSKKTLKLLPSSKQNSNKNINNGNSSNNNKNISENSSLQNIIVPSKIVPLKPNVNLISLKDLEYNFDNLMNLGLRGNKQYK